MSIALRKEIAKAKSVSHPNSRKSLAIIKKTNKVCKRQKVKLGGVIKQNLMGEKLLWLQEHMLPDICPYTPQLTADLLEAYISRHDEELEQISLKRSIGGKRHRQHASREDIVRMTKEREREEYNTCGIEIPDILTISQCQMLRNWNKELRLLSNFKFRRFGKAHLNEILKRKEKKSQKVVTANNQNNEKKLYKKTESVIDSLEKNNFVELENSMDVE